MNVQFNINNKVRVKLTDYGRLAHCQNHTAFLETIPSEIVRESLPYRPPVEDADGWSEWQMWCLMSEFGASISHARQCFETTIELIDVKPL